MTVTTYPQRTGNDRFAASYPAPYPSGSVDADTAALAAFFSSLPTGAVVVFPQLQSYTVHAGCIWLKAGIKLDLNGCTITRATQVSASTTATVVNGATTVVVDSVSGFAVGQTIGICTVDRTTGWSSAPASITAIDSVAKTLTVSGSGRAINSFALKNGSGTVASLAVGAGGGVKVFTIGPMVASWYAEPIVSASQFVLPIDPKTLANTSLIVAGATLTGGTSGHAATVVGYAPDRLIVTAPTVSAAFNALAFTPGENVTISGSTVATLSSAYCLSTTWGAGHYCYPGIELRNGCIDGNRANATYGGRWEIAQEVALATYGGRVENVEIRNGMSEGLVLSGRDITVEALAVVNCAGNGVHFSDYDGVTGCWDVKLAGLRVNGAVNGTSDYLTGHADGCLTWSNNVRRIEVAQFDLRNSRAYGFGAINSADNSEVYLHDGKITNCLAGAWSITAPSSGSLSNVVLHDIEVVDSGTAQYTDSTGAAAWSGATLGGYYSGEAAAKSWLTDVLMHDIAFTFNVQPASPSGGVIRFRNMRRAKVHDVHVRALAGFGDSDGVVFTGLEDAQIANVFVDDVSTGYSGRAGVQILGNTYRNVDFSNIVAKGGQYGIYWNTCASALSTGYFQNVRAFGCKAIDNAAKGILYDIGDYASEFVTDGDGAFYTAGQVPANWNGFYYNQPSTRTSIPWIRTRAQVSGITAGWCTGSGATYSYTVSGGAVASVTITAGGASYPTGPVQFVIPNSSGRPAVCTATVTAGAINNAVTIVDAGSGYSAGSTGTIGSSSAYSLYFQTNCANVEFGGAYARAPTFASGMSQVIGRGCFWEYSGWSAPASTGVQWQNCWTYGQRSNTAITVTASPFTYTNPLTDDTLIQVDGGTVSLVEVTYKGANTTFKNAGAGAGVYAVGGGCQIRVTYTVAPTMNRFVV